MKHIDRKGHFIMKNKIVIILSLFIFDSVIFSAPLGFLEPYNFMIEAEPIYGKSRFQWTMLTQLSFDTMSFDEEGNKVNALQIYEPAQNVLGLFQGLGNASQFNQLVNSLAGGSGGGVNNGENGMFTPTGVFDGAQVAFLASYMFHQHCYFKIAVPVYKINLTDVNWLYTGSDDTFAGQSIQTELVSSFITSAQQDFNLAVGDWSETGLGDITMLLDYVCDYPQGRSVLRNVRVHLRLGLSVPTGILANENQVMSVPFGNDGSVGLPFGGGLDINLGRYFQCGFRGQFLYLWGNEKLRRVASFPGQTTLLLPQVAMVYKEYGFVQEFDLYAQAYNIVGGLSLKLAYEYYRKAQDLISVQTPGFNYEQINTDLRLNEETRHNLITVLSFDSAFLQHCPRLHPQVSIFVNTPFNGSCTSLLSTVGLQLALDF